MGAFLRLLAPERRLLLAGAPRPLLLLLLLVVVVILPLSAAAVAAGCAGWGTPGSCNAAVADVRVSKYSMQ
jgi:hypothetical protein